MVVFAQCWFCVKDPCPDCVVVGRGDSEPQRAMVVV